MNTWIVPQTDYGTAWWKAQKAVHNAPGLSMLTKEAREAIVRLILDALGEEVEK